MGNRIIAQVFVLTLSIISEILDVIKLLKRSSLNIVKIDYNEIFTLDR